MRSQPTADSFSAIRTVSPPLLTSKAFLSAVSVGERWPHRKNRAPLALGAADGWVEFAEAKVAELAAMALNAKTIGGKKVRCCAAAPVPLPVPLLSCLLLSPLLRNPPRDLTDDDSLNTLSHHDGTLGLCSLWPPGVTATWGGLQASDLFSSPPFVQTSFASAPKR